MAFDKKDTFALGNTMKNLDFSDRVKNIKCSTLILCGKKDSANMKSAYYLSQNVKGAEPVVNSKLKIYIFSFLKLRIYPFPKDSYPYCQRCDDSE